MDDSVTDRTSLNGKSFISLPCASSLLHELCSLSYFVPKVHTLISNSVPAGTIFVSVSCFLSDSLTSPPSLQSKKIGHFFFWYVRSEVAGCPYFRQRMAVILEAYLLGCGQAMLDSFTKQVQAVEALQEVAIAIKNLYPDKTDLSPTGEIQPRKTFINQKKTQCLQLFMLLFRVHLSCKIDFWYQQDFCLVFKRWQILKSKSKQQNARHYDFSL